MEEELVEDQIANRLVGLGEEESLSPPQSNFDESQKQVEKV